MGRTVLGEDCKYRAGGYVPDDVPGILNIMGETVDFAEIRLGAELPRCTRVSELVIVDEPPPMLSAEVLFDAIRVELPKPDLVVAPGRALAGLPAWLETNRPLEFTMDGAGLARMPGGLIDVTATATFDVDWGDGTVETGFERQGVAFNADDRDDPAGIRHGYTDAGDVTITVTDHWTITFEDQWGRSDTFVGDIATSTTLPVIQAQAVIVG